MNTFTRFLYDFLSQFFGGIGTIFKGIVNGFKQIFNFSNYRDVIQQYSGDLSMSEWVLTVISVGVMIIVLAMFFGLIFLIFRKYFKFRKKNLDQDALLNEVATLNNKVADLMKEKDEIMAMKVSQLGLKPSDTDLDDDTVVASDETDEDLVQNGIRFSKLNDIDEEYKNYKIKNYGNTFTLPELCANFRNFAASKLHLYYTEKMMRV